MATTIAVTQRFRKLPALSQTFRSDEAPAGKEGRCARLTGHVLVVKGDRVECERCGATWKDEGF